MINNSKILIVEDDININNLLFEILNDAGYKVIQSYSGTEAKLWLEKENFDLILLDLMLPGLSGEELVSLIRERHTMPILIISANLNIITKVELLQMGADDYIEKPFDIKEVLARVEAQLRRYKEFSNTNQSNILRSKNLILNEDEMKVTINNNILKLTKKEYDIIHLLLRYPKKVFTKSNLFEKVWDDEVYIDDNSLNVHISNLRNKIAEYDSENEYIETVWGIGFKLKS